MGRKARRERKKRGRDCNRRRERERGDGEKEREKQGGEREEKRERAHTQDLLRPGLRTETTVLLPHSVGQSNS